MQFSIKFFLSLQQIYLVKFNVSEFSQINSKLKSTAVEIKHLNAPL